MKLFISILLTITCWQGLFAQTITPQVLNSAGGHREVGNSGIFITDNVGEPFTESVGYNIKAMMITQGFIQPETVSRTGFTLNPIQQHHLCMDKQDDAFIDLQMTSSITNYDVKYLWSNPVLCPNNDCPKVDTLDAGPYSVTVAITYTTNIGLVRRDTLQQSFYINAATELCIIKVFSGVSANNDGANDFFTVENLKEFPNSRVTIYNRWGTQLFDMKGYNHEDSKKRWPSDEELNTLTSSTYFYIIELGNGTKPLKGWVELIKN